MFSHTSENRFERRKHGLSSYQLVLVTDQFDEALQKSFLGRDGLGGDTDCRRPRLVEAGVFGVGRPGTKSHGIIVHLEVIHDGAFGAVGDDLGDAEVMTNGRIGDGRILGDSVGQFVDPTEGQIAHHASSLPHMGSADREQPTWTDVDEFRHTCQQTPGWREEWAFWFWSHDGSIGGYTGITVVGEGRSTQYWAALVRRGEPLLQVCELHGPPLRVSPSLLLKAEGLWADHDCESPFGQWTVTNECFAVALEDPDEVYRRSYGVATPMALDLEWYAESSPSPVEGGYEQAGTAHAVVELADGELEGEFLSRRTHRWGSWPWASEVVPTGGLRAPLSVDGVYIERVLGPTGWTERRLGDA